MSRDELNTSASRFSLAWSSSSAQTAAVMSLIKPSMCSSCPSAPKIPRPRSHTHLDAPCAVVMR
jgi:hypothetical protein